MRKPEAVVKPKRQDDPNQPVFRHSSSRKLQGFSADGETDYMVYKAAEILRSRQSAGEEKGKCRE